MGTENLTGAMWRKASYSNGNGGNCVEFAALSAGDCAVRDSKDPAGAVLALAAAQWAAFASATAAGEFD